MKKAIKNYAISIAIALAVGGLSALLTRDSMIQFGALAKPPLAPPAWLFPIVWTILFILMGIGAAMVYRSDDKDKGEALFIYGVQLAVNFFWTILFFNLEARFVAFIWLLFLLFLVILMTIRFYRASKTAGLLQIPYLLWLVFAAYLNLAVWLLNR